MTAILPNIAFIGRAGSGKTTAREYLEEAYGYERISFAAPLKVGCGTNDDRGLLQRVGQGVRDLHADFWVNLALQELERRPSYVDGDQRQGPRWANDDCRYPNEATALMAEGFLIVRVLSIDSQRLDRLKLNGRLQSEDQLTHISETSLDDFDADFVIGNYGWKEDLHRTLDDIVNGARA